VVENNRLILNHQFGIRQRHSTIEHTHQIVRRIHEALENKQYCSAAFLDISQAFNKVRHWLKIQISTLSLGRLQLEALHNRTVTLNRTKDTWSSWEQAILFCSIFRHLSSIQRSMALVENNRLIPIHWFGFR
jgi:hypothetical protein